MPKTTAITDEERNLFRDAVSDVKPRQTQTTTKLEPTVTISPEETITIKIKPISLKNATLFQKNLPSTLKITNPIFPAMTSFLFQSLDYNTKNSQN